MTTTKKSEKSRQVLTEIVGDLNCLREAVQECTGDDTGFVLSTFTSESDGSSNLTNADRKSVSGALAELLKEGCFEHVANHVMECRKEAYAPASSNKITFLAGKEIEGVFEKHGVQDEYLLLIFPVGVSPFRVEYASNISKPQRLESVVAGAATNLYTV